MSPFRTLLSHHSLSLLKPQNPHAISQITHRYSAFFPIFHRFFNSHQTENQTKPRKPLDLLFKEAVELSPKPQTPESESETEDNPVKKSLRDLEKALRSLKANSKKNEPANSKKKESANSKAEVSLYALFTDKAAPADPKKPNKAAVAGGERKWKELARDNSKVFKELSQEMEVVVNHLYKEGYLKGSNFLSVKDDRLDFSCFNNSYGRDFIKFAAEKFARDNLGIAKWLSASDLKKVALFGCPSLARKSVFGAKRLRKFFQIQEDTVCSKCVLKQSCKFANKNVWNKDTKNLNLTDVMSTITLYALDYVPPQLVVPDEVKSSVSQLLNEVLKLSQATS